MTEREKMLWQYCDENADAIYVRAQVDGKWKSVPLSGLDREKWAPFVAEWLRRSMLPYLLAKGAHDVG